MDIILDSAIVPSFPGIGAQLSHAHLMSRPRQGSLPVSLERTDTHTVKSLATSDKPAESEKTYRSDAVRRTASLDDISIPQPQYSRSNLSRPSARPTNSHKHEIKKVGRSHNRSASDSFPIPKPVTAKKSLPSIPSKPSKTTLQLKKSSPTLGPDPARSTPLEASLCAPGDSISVIALADCPTIHTSINQIRALIPPSRIPNTPQSSYNLSPAILLIPLSIILEALVCERSVLRGTPPPSLPVLQDGASLTLSKGTGQLDWTMVAMYIRALSACLDDLLPLLHAAPEAAELFKTIRIYVGKTKKVFGEVAAMYVDGYGFVRGWWDEEAMKECARVVGKWGEALHA